MKILSKEGKITIIAENRDEDKQLFECWMNNLTNDLPEERNKQWCMETTNNELSFTWREPTNFFAK